MDGFPSLIVKSPFRRSDLWEITPTEAFSGHPSVAVAESQCRATKSYVGPIELRWAADRQVGEFLEPNVCRATLRDPRFSWVAEGWHLDRISGSIPSMSDVLLPVSLRSLFVGSPIKWSADC